MSAEFGRLREFLLQEERRVKERLQKQKEEKLGRLEEALARATARIGRLEGVTDQLQLKLMEERPEQLRVSEGRA